MTDWNMNWLFALFLFKGHAAMPEVLNKQFEGSKIKVYAI